MLDVTQFDSIPFNSKMCQFCSQKANYRNSRTKITTDSEQDTNETHNKNTKEYLNN
jgi:hypothetical protein